MDSIRDILMFKIYDDLLDFFLCFSFLLFELGDGLAGKAELHL